MTENTDKIDNPLGVIVNKELTEPVTPPVYDLPITSSLSELEFGRIKNYIPERGFGFISRLEKTNMYFHITSVDPMYRDIKTGDSVSFKVRINRDGRSMAICVKKLK